MIKLQHDPIDWTLMWRPHAWSKKVLNANLKTLQNCSTTDYRGDLLRSPSLYLSLSLPPSIVSISNSPFPTSDVWTLQPVGTLTEEDNSAIDQNLNPEIEIKSKPKRLVNITGFEKSLEPMCRVYLSSSSSPSAECIKLMFFSLSIQFHHMSTQKQKILLEIFFIINNSGCTRSLWRE